MKKINYFIRFLYIQYILAKYGIDRVVFLTRWFRPFSFVIFLNPWNWFRPSHEKRGVAVRQALEKLGPIFVKFGQVLSTRHDLVPHDIITELTQLQNNVPPFPTSEARKIIETKLGKPIEELFISFDNEPLAAASIAQIHTAVLPNGKSVIIKILRPAIQKRIQEDIAILYSLANMAEYSTTLRRLKPKAIIHEFEISLLDELDLLREAGNASQFRRNFANSPLLYIPEVYWDYTNHHIMVMERINGIPILDKAALKAHHINLPKLAENGLEIFFNQVFRDSFFHADMHPGNIFVDTKNPENPQYICVDFGIIGTLSDKDKRYIAENLLAFFHRDYRRIAQLHIESKWVDEDVRIERFESAIRAVSEPIFEKPLREISFANVLLNLIETARAFHINIQPQLILLQKTLFSVEGLARYLHPDLDLWVTAKPFLERWVEEQVGFKAFWKHTQNQLPFIVDHLPEFPKLLHRFLTLHSQSPRHVTVTHKKPSGFFFSMIGFSIGVAAGIFIVYAFF
jgi:ubiquinone biosynthesis protein